MARSRNAPGSPGAVGTTTRMGVGVDAGGLAFCVGRKCIAEGNRDVGVTPKTGTDPMSNESLAPIGFFATSVTDPTG